MKRVLPIIFAIVSFTLAFSATLAMAQQTPGSADDSSSVGGKFSLRTFRGCLSHFGDQYELAVTGSVPRQYRLVGSNLSQLDSKVGHLVSITGTIPEIPSATNTNSTNAESDTINFLSLEDLASTCDASSMGPSETLQPAAAMASVQEPWQTPTPSLILFPDPPVQPGSYMIVPLVGALALGLLQFARFRQQK